jgi:LmbE family N-acetylglucosaminyl deacetylase
MRVATSYGARGIICDLEDEGILSVKASIPEIMKIIRKELPLKTFDILFTHGANGEYGHPRHKGVRQAVKQMLAKKQIRAKDVFFFSYVPDKKRKIAVPKRRSPLYVELSTDEWKAKRNVIQKLYGFRPHIFENRSCAKVETFTK